MEVIARQLAGVRPHDIATFTTATAILLVMTLSGGLVPALAPFASTPPRHCARRVTIGVSPAPDEA
jgi:hypothetical protein